MSAIGVASSGAVGSRGMMFVTFALTFLTLKDEDRSAVYEIWLQVG